MPNKQRGELEVKLGKKTYLLRPTFEGLCEVEDRAGIGLSGLMMKFARQQGGIRDVAALIYGGLVGADCREFTYAQVGEFVRRRGVAFYMRTAVEFLKEGISGEEEDQGNGQAAGKEEEAEPTTEPTALQ